MSIPCRILVVHPLATFETGIPWGPYDYSSWPLRICPHCTHEVFETFLPTNDKLSRCGPNAVPTKTQCVDNRLHPWVPNICTDIFEYPGFVTIKQGNNIQEREKRLEIAKISCRIIKFLSSLLYVDHLERKN